MEKRVVRIRRRRVKKLKTKPGASKLKLFRGFIWKPPVLAGIAMLSTIMALSISDSVSGITPKTKIGGEIVEGILGLVRKPRNLDEGLNLTRSITRNLDEGLNLARSTTRNLDDLELLKLKNDLELRKLKLRKLKRNTNIFSMGGRFSGELGSLVGTKGSVKLPPGFKSKPLLLNPSSRSPKIIDKVTDLQEVQITGKDKFGDWVEIEFTRQGELIQGWIDTASICNQGSLPSCNAGNLPVTDLIEGFTSKDFTSNAVVKLKFPETKRNGLYVHGIPSTGGSSVTSLPHGTKLQVIDRYYGWFVIIYADTNKSGKTVHQVGLAASAYIDNLN